MKGWQVKEEGKLIHWEIMDELQNIQPYDNLQKSQFIKQQLEARESFNQIGLLKLVQPKR
jgi:hypothetical protein